MPDKLLSFKACLASNTFAEDHKNLVCPLTGPEGCPLRTFYLSCQDSYRDWLWRQRNHEARRKHSFTYLQNNQCYQHLLHQWDNYVQILYPLTTWRWTHDNISTVTNYWVTSSQKLEATRERLREVWQRTGGERAKMLPNILCYCQMQSLPEQLVRCLKAPQLPVIVHIHAASVKPCLM